MDFTRLMAIRFFVESFFDDDSESEEEKEKVVSEKVWEFAEKTVPRFEDHQFQRHFRMKRTTFKSVLRKIRTLPATKTNIGGYPETALEKQILITLWYLANIESMRGVSNRFGLSKSTTWRAVYKICDLLLEANIRFKIITLPNEENCIATRDYVRQKTGFPGVIGAVDGSHIPIISPTENHASYVNRKGFHSVLLQGTCNEKKEFIHCYTGEVGSVHDAAVLRRSNLVNIIQCPPDCHLLGDSAYPLSTKLLVPFKDNGHLTNIQKLYNKTHSTARVVIEQAFALLKGRWRRLKLLETKRLDLLISIIMASCILHNICLWENDMPDDMNLEDEINEERIMNVHNGIVENNEDRVNKRNDIANYLYLRHLRNELLH